MKYLRLGVVVAVLLALTYGLYQWCGTSASAPVAVKPAAKSDAPKFTSVAPSIQPPVQRTQAAPLVASVAMPNANAPTAAISTDEPQPHGDLKECIAQTIKLLEAKDVAAFIKTLMPPSLVQQMIASGQANSIEDIVVQYSQRPDINEKMAQLQQALETVKDLNPEISSDGLRATYKDIPSFTNTKGNAEVVFVQVDGNWYLH